MKKSIRDFDRDKGLLAVQKNDPIRAIGAFGHLPCECWLSIDQEESAT